MVGNLPNLLTLARILLLPFFAATLIYEEYQYALLLFIAASVTDFLDGLVARIRKQITYFGITLVRFVQSNMVKKGIWTYSY